MKVVSGSEGNMTEGAARKRQAHEPDTTAGLVSDRAVLTTLLEGTLMATALPETLTENSAEWLVPLSVLTFGDIANRLKAFAAAREPLLPHGAIELFRRDGVVRPVTECLGRILLHTIASGPLSIADENLELQAPGRLAAARRRGLQAGQPLLQQGGSLSHSSESPLPGSERAGASRPPSAGQIAPGDCAKGHQDFRNFGSVAPSRSPHNGRVSGSRVAHSGERPSGLEKRPFIPWGAPTTREESQYLSRITLHTVVSPVTPQLREAEISLAQRNFEDDELNRRARLLREIPPLENYRRRQRARIRVNDILSSNKIHLPIPQDLVLRCRRAATRLLVRGTLPQLRRRELIARCCVPIPDKLKELKRWMIDLRQTQQSKPSLLRHGDTSLALKARYLDTEAVAPAPRISAVSETDRRRLFSRLLEIPLRIPIGIKPSPAAWARSVAAHTDKCRVVHLEQLRRDGCGTGQGSATPAHSAPVAALLKKIPLLKFISHPSMTAGVRSPHENRHFVAHGEWEIVVRRWRDIAMSRGAAIPHSAYHATARYLALLGGGKPRLGCRRENQRALRRGAMYLDTHPECWLSPFNCFALEWREAFLVYRDPTMLRAEHKALQEAWECMDGDFKALWLSHPLCVYRWKAEVSNLAESDVSHWHEWTNSLRKRALDMSLLMQEKHDATSAQLATTFLGQESAREESFYEQLVTLSTPQDRVSTQFCEWLSRAAAGSSPLSALELRAKQEQEAEREICQKVSDRNLSFEELHLLHDHRGKLAEARIRLAGCSTSSACSESPITLSRYPSDAVREVQMRSRRPLCEDRSEATGSSESSPKRRKFAQHLVQGEAGTSRWTAPGSQHPHTPVLLAREMCDVPSGVRKEAVES